MLAGRDSVRSPNTIAGNSGTTGIGIQEKATKDIKNVIDRLDAVDDESEDGSDEEMAAQSSSSEDDGNRVLRK